MAKRKSRSQYHHGDLRTALMEAAVELAAREGVDAVLLSTLARKTGVSGTAPFRHFPSRQALLVAVAEEGARRLIARMQAATAGETDPGEAQRRGAMAYVRFAVEEPGYFRILTRAETLQESELVASLNTGARKAMEAAFGGSAASVSAEVTARSAAHLAAQALVFGLARMLVDGLLGEVDGATAERLAFEVTGVLGQGLEATLAPGPRRP
ncbi:TetR/AcrR family transcriptional regulator [Archangium lipolyticum]|uniref:TetR/AcrR family transcriptional regulator n=1 Tax=Archangium lipolyticum TaxID=2970465 RepID=UPI00214A11BA|nr:TetR/AcrR family transcriptional regulator [Archangium lipolyticum]